MLLYTAQSSREQPTVLSTSNWRAKCCVLLLKSLEKKSCNYFNCLSKPDSFKVFSMELTITGQQWWNHHNQWNWDRNWQHLPDCKLILTAFTQDTSDHFNIKTVKANLCSIGAHNLTGKVKASDKSDQLCSCVVLYVFLWLHFFPH